MTFEILLQIELDGPDTPEAAQERVERLLNAGEFFEVCKIFSVRSVPSSELEEDDDAWLETPERFDTSEDGTLVDRAEGASSIVSAGAEVEDPQCMVPKCTSSVFWRGPQGMRLCVGHFDRLKGRVSSIEDAKLSDDVIRAGRCIDTTHERSKKFFTASCNETTDEVKQVPRWDVIQRLAEVNLTVSGVLRVYQAESRGSQLVRVVEALTRVNNQLVQDEIERQKKDTTHLRMMYPVGINTEVQLHCEKHGEVMAFNVGNGTLHCPKCYNASLIKVEDIGFKQQVDKCFELPQRSFKVDGASSGKFEILQVKVAKPLADYIVKCGQDALVYGCEIVRRRTSTQDDEDTQAARCCADPKVRGGRCTSCGTWLADRGCVVTREDDEG